MGDSLARLQYLSHCSHDPIPEFFFRVQLFATRGGQSIGLDPAALLSGRPFAQNPTFLLETMKRGEERSGLHVKRPVGHLSNPVGDSDAVERLRFESAQN